MQRSSPQTPHRWCLWRTRHGVRFHSSTSLSAISPNNISTAGSAFSLIPPRSARLLARARFGIPPPQCRRVRPSFRPSTASSVAAPTKWHEASQRRALQGACAAAAASVPLRFTHRLAGSSALRKFRSHSHVVYPARRFANAVA